jgi:lysophospholipase L1-like esterase
MHPQFKLLLCAVAFSWAALSAAAADSTARPTVFLIGDSTMTNQSVIPATPLRGWGQMLPLYFKEGVRIENHAMSGRSSKSFLAEGRWKVVLERLKEGDYVVIQFGHNDQKDKDPKRFTGPFGDFTVNLARYVKETRERKALPILVTPVSRSVWDKEGKFTNTHGDYPKAVKQLATGQNVPVLDLEARTRELLLKLGPERSKSLFANAEPGDFANLPEGRKDGTHFNAAGACRVCDFAVEELKTAVPELAKWLKTGTVDPTRP